MDSLEEVRTISGESGEGGALFVGDRSTAELEGVHVEECSAEVGGALYAEYGTFSIEGSNIVDSCDGGLGAAVHYDVASPYVIHGVGRTPRISATNFSWRDPGRCKCSDCEKEMEDRTATVMVDAKASIDWVCSLGQYAPPLGDFDGHLLEDGAYGFTGCPKECLPGTYGNRTNLTTSECSDMCDPGHYCPAGTSKPKPCPVGTHMPTAGASDISLCLPCGPGTASDREANNGTSCAPCDPGSYAEGLNNTFCSPCPERGYCSEVGAASAAMAWRPCPAGTFSNKTGLSSADQCDPCRRGHWCDFGYEFACNRGEFNDNEGGKKPDACERCPFASDTAAAGSDAASACTCLTQYYAASRDARGRPLCRFCSRSMDCGGAGSTLAELKLRPGYWRLSNSSSTIYRCPSREVCDGGNATAGRRLGEGGDNVSVAAPRWGLVGLGCREGHRGPLCSGCDDRWAMGLDGFCEPCTPATVREAWQRLRAASSSRSS